MQKNIIRNTNTIKEALEHLNAAGSRTNLTLFVVDENQKLLATLTDGDIRRGLLKGGNITDPISGVMNRNCKYLKKNEISTEKIKELKENEIFLVPVVDDDLRIEKIIDLQNIRASIPVDVLIMAGGEGTRLRPLTEYIPKPLLKVGDKAILEYTIERLGWYGVDNIYLSVKYLAEKIEEHFGDGRQRNIRIQYVRESSPLGTIASLKLVPGFEHNHVLVMNSDLLTNIDFNDFYNYFRMHDADMAVASIPYNHNVPYAVLEIKEDIITSLKEKPTYTYYSNGGIYLLKKKVIDLIPDDRVYNATDLMEEVIKRGMKLINYPILGYWLDIGNHADYLKAQEDIRHIQL